MNRFELSEAWLLLLLPLALAAFWRLWRRRRQPAMAWSVVSRVRAAGVGAAARLRWLPHALRALALALLVICISRPVRINEQTSTLSDGVAIELVVDRSSSMLSLDFQRNGKPIDRLSALKDVVDRFVNGGANLAGRRDDLIGLVTFAHFADSISPLTMDHEWLLAGLKDIKPADPSIGDDGTAIGDAVALGAEKLRDATEGRARDGAGRIKSKVLILLTDGENNAGDIDPMTAAELCKSLGIRLYAVGMGTRGVAMMPVQTPFGTQMVRQPVDIDEKLLTKMAEATGGQYFRATDTRSLEKIYERIDQLEKTVTEQKRTILAKDLSVEGFKLGGVAVPSILSLVLIVLAVELSLSHTRLRSLP
jgi:Ca-activated chloride channel family protein